MVQRKGETHGGAKGSEKRISDTATLSDSVSITNSDIDAFTLVQGSDVNVPTERNSHGQWVKGKKGGPGRGHKSATKTSETEQGPEGDGDVDLLAAFHAALKEVGAKKFCKRLIKESPVVASQLLSSLTKSSATTGRPNEHISIYSNMPIPNIDESQQTGGVSDHVPTPARDNADTTSKLADGDPPPAMSWTCTRCPSRTVNDCGNDKCSICGYLKSGERPPEPEEEAVTKDLTRQVGEVEGSEAGVVWVALGKVISLELPSREVIVHRVYDVSVSFVGGGEPVGLGFVFVSPSGRQFRRPMTSSVIFDEAGEWTILVVIEDQMILGKTITVEYRLLDDLIHSILPRYGLLIASPVLAAIILIVMGRRWGKKKREMNRHP